MRRCFLSIFVAAVVALPATPAASVTCDGVLHATTLEDPLAGDGLSDIDASSRLNAWAVGYRSVFGGVSKSYGYARHWDGQTWSRTDTAHPRWNQPLAVLTFGRASWMVGRRGDPLTDGGDAGSFVQRWNGSSWRTPRNLPRVLRRYSSYLTELDGTSKADVWAAGTTYSSFGSRLLVLHWDGSGWSRVVTPVVPTDPFTNVRVTGLAVADVDDVWLLGHSIVSSKTVNFALHWDGAAWASVSFPDLGGAELEGIAADGVGGVWVVGPNVIGGRPGVVLRWDGVSWQNLSIVSGYTYTKLFFVSAGPSGPVVTGFGRNFGSDETVPLILRRVSGGWLEIPTDIGSLSSGGPIDITSTGHLFALVHGASEPSALVGCGF